MDLHQALRNETTAVVLVAIALALALLALAPRARASTRTALVIAAIALVAHLAAMALAAASATTAAEIAADAAVITMGIAYVRLAAIALFRLLLPLLRITPAKIVEDIVSVVAILGWGLVWLRLAGVELGSLVTTSAVITAVLAFSMQETLGNLLGGVVLQIDRSIRVGDWVKVDDASGRVVEIGWRHTAIETRNRETVVVPNGWLVKNRFTVIGSRADAKPLWRRWVYFDLTLDAPALVICEALAKSVNEAEIAHVSRDPAASAVLLKVGDGFGHFGLRYFLDDPQPDDVTDTLVRAHALAALARHGLSLAVTREERLLIKDNDAHRSAELALERARRRDALSRVDLFSALSEDERAALAEHLAHAPFVAGDVITRQGAVAHWLYLIMSGEADVWVESERDRTFIRTLSAGQVFGEMGLMTGQPRAATVTARTDLECYRIDKAGFESILRSRPDIAASMATILAERERERAQRVESAAAVSARRSAADTDILASIRGFFGLDR